MHESAGLELRNISKRFETPQTLSHVSVRLQPGTVHSMLGENGASKTTLMRIAFGIIAPDEGNVLIGDTVMRLRSPADAIDASIGMVHQHFMLVPAMTVTENVELGFHGRYNETKAASRVTRLGKETGLLLDPGAKVGSLGAAAQQRLEIHQGSRAPGKDPHPG